MKEKTFDSFDIVLSVSIIAGAWKGCWGPFLFFVGWLLLAEFIQWELLKERVAREINNPLTK